MLKRRAETSSLEHYSIGRLLSPRDEAIDLDAAAYAAALEMTRKAWRPDPGRGGNSSGPKPPGPAKRRRHPLCPWPRRGKCGAGARTGPAAALPSRPAEGRRSVWQQTDACPGIRAELSVKRLRGQGRVPGRPSALGGTWLGRLTSSLPPGRALSGSDLAAGWRTIPVTSAGACRLSAGRRFPGNEEAFARIVRRGA